jgi:hypothetical protein
VPAIWTEDPTIGNALAGVANAMYGGPMLQLHTMETMQNIRMRQLEYQKLQEHLALTRQLSDVSSGLFAGPDTGMLGGNTSGGQPPSSSQEITGQSPSSPSLSSGSQDTGMDATPPIGAGSTAGALAPTQTRGSAGYKAPLANYYALQMHLAASNGDLVGLQRWRDEASAVLNEDFGATNAREAIQYHNLYSDLKGPAAHGFSSQLQNHVEGGGQLTLPQAHFLARYADNNSPLTFEGTPEAPIPKRGMMPVSQATINEIARNGINLPGFPAGGTGAPPSAGAPGTPSVAGQPGAQLAPGAGFVTTPGYTQHVQNAETMKILQDPDYQNARSTGVAARQVIENLATKSTPGDRLALSLLIRTAVPTARVQGQSDEQVANLQSKLQQMQDYWGKIFDDGGHLPDPVRQQIAKMAAGNAIIMKGNYDTKYGPQSVLSQQWRGQGLAPEQIVPDVEGLPAYDPETFRWGGPQIGQPIAPGPQSAPGQKTAPGPRTPSNTTQDDLERLLRGP